MENNSKTSKGNGLIDPQKIAYPEKKQPKKVNIRQDGLMEREETKVLTEDGRELLKEN